MASSHFNFTVIEPMGIIGVVAPDDRPLLSLLTLILPAIVSGNSVVALASYGNPMPAILLGEILAVSDLPGGVINLLTGLRSDILPTFASHEHIRGIHACIGADQSRELQAVAAESVKRVHLHEPNTNWFSSNLDSPYEIGKFTEAKTVWHPIGT